MGLSLSSNNNNSRRRQNRHHPPPPPPPYYYHHPTADLSSYPPPPPPSYVYPPPPLQVPSYYNTATTMNGRYNNNYNYPFNYNPNQGHGWAQVRSGATFNPASVPVPVPPPYVEHQNAKKVRSDVNVHKNTLRLEVDEENPDHVLVSFVFDAMYDGSITIFYFAKEEPDCNKFVPVYPETYMPVKIPFQKGVGQKFLQPSGTGIDLGFFELDDLLKPSQGEDIFPLVVSAETCFLPSTIDDHLEKNTSAHMQITQAVLEKNNDDAFKVRVIRQILWVDGVRYELREIYGMGGSTAQDFNDSEPGKECVICMTEPKDTAILPCRHMCMCSECAKELRIQSNKCPICRQPIEELIEIKIISSDQ